MTRKEMTAFYAGVVHAVAALKGFDQPTMVAEIVKDVGEDELLRVARRRGEMRWSGLDAYVRARRAAAQLTEHFARRATGRASWTIGKGNS